MEIEARIDTPETIRERVANALGFDEPSALDLVDRNKYRDEDSYLDAAVKAELERSTPEYRATRNRLKAELRERTEREQREAQSAAYKTIRANAQLDYLDRRNIDTEAADLAHSDLAAGRIAASALGETVAKYADFLTEKRKDEKASAQLFNAMIRGAM